MGKRQSWSDAGARRVESALQSLGVLLLQGQSGIPSVADLLHNAPVTTRGFSWDYVPAWDYTDFLLDRGDVELLKLFEGRRTLVAKRLWPAVSRLARAAHDRVMGGEGPPVHRAMLSLVASEPGISGERLKAGACRHLHLQVARFRRIRAELEAWLCLVSAERTDVDYHTHDLAWFLWEHGRVSRAIEQERLVLPDIRDALAMLTNCLASVGIPKNRIKQVLPVVKLLAGSVQNEIELGLRATS